MKSENKLFFLLFIITFCILEANSRVALSRPGKMLRIPSADFNNQKNLFSINLSSEIVSSQQNNSAFSVNFSNNLGYKYGLSFSKPIDPANSLELGFHIQKNILQFDDIFIEVGAHDILYRQGSESYNGIDTKGISLFGVISSKKNINDYSISTHMGVGTGKINSDSQIYFEDPKQRLDAFLGFRFMDLRGNTLIAEYDGAGINLGLAMPIFINYSINIGITKFDEFNEFATEDRTQDDYSLLKADAPSLLFGISMDIPNISEKNDNVVQGNGIYAKTDSSILYYDPICTEVVELLKDSISLNKNTIENLSAYNKMLQHQEAILIDSTRNNILREEIIYLKQNESMRHLSRSLRFFYDERYKDALSEINASIELSPNLAIAYGRRGSIYYKLGDKRRAILNWNIALQLDPEFIEIYDILKAVNKDNLSSTEIGKK
tara:strand:- start:204 stop:1508 length:1305 start_codon:yes stop_codon:yes gene_type:complete